MLKSKPEKHGRTLSPRPRRRISVLVVEARINSLDGYKLKKRYRRVAPPYEQYFVLRTTAGVELLCRADFVNLARDLKALAPNEFMND